MISYFMKKNLAATITLLIFILLLISPALLLAKDNPYKSKSMKYGLPDFTVLAEKLTPVTVNIQTTKVIKPRVRQYNSPFGNGPRQQDPFDDFFRQFFGDSPRERKERGGGSGFIIDNNGYIITNNHVIAGADEIIVKTHDDKEYEAEIIGTDKKTDIALIKLKKFDSYLPHAKLGDSDKLQVGEWVLAIGNPFGLQETVTAGIVSAKERAIGAGPYDDFIQTDASINPGNSGGPLFDLNGEVVGVNAMIFSPSGGNVGIGFAIPINLAKKIVEQLKNSGKVVRGWLGVTVQTVTKELADHFNLEEGKGALIAGVEKGSPADKYGIITGDVIIKFDGIELAQMSDLPGKVADTPVGKMVNITVIRDNKIKVIRAKVGQLKDEVSEISEVNEKGEIGIVVREITPEFANSYGLEEKSGIIVTHVEPGSAVAESGIMKGDIIKEINRKLINSISDYNEAMNKSTGNILFLVKRGRSTLWVVVKTDKK
jgi:serine protease Do